jgi:hypothetical protein
MRWIWATLVLTFSMTAMIRSYRDLKSAVIAFMSVVFKESRFFVYATKSSDKLKVGGDPSIVLEGTGAYRSGTIGAAAVGAVGCAIDHRFCPKRRFTGDPPSLVDSSADCRCPA